MTTTTFFVLAIPSGSLVRTRMNQKYHPWGRPTRIMQSADCAPKRSPSDTFGPRALRPKGIPGALRLACDDIVRPPWNATADLYLRKQGRKSNIRGKKYNSWIPQQSVEIETESRQDASRKKEFQRVFHSKCEAAQSTCQAICWHRIFPKGSTKATTL